MDRPYLFPTPQNSDVCLLCNEKILAKDVKKVRKLDEKGWLNLVNKAQEWSKLNIPLSDRCFAFTQVLAKVKDAPNPFGRRHESCRVTFSGRLQRYRDTYGEINDSDSVEASLPQISLDIGGETSAKRVTRSSSEYISSFEKKCFVCSEVRVNCENNAYNSGGLGRCERQKASSNIMQAMKVYIEEEDHRFHKAAKRVEILLSGQSHDAHSADLYYHQSCYRNFVRLPKEKQSSKELDVQVEISALNDFLTSIELNILKEENAYLLNQLLEDWLQLCEVRGVSTVILRTNQLRKRLEEKFGDDIGFFPSGKHVIVHSAWLNPCQYSVATLKGAGLRDIDLAKGFASMIKRKNSLPTASSFPYSLESLIEELDRGPMTDLYNIIHLTVKGTCVLNEFGYATTNSRNLAAKIWSLAYDWQALITGKINAKQVLLGMTIHRLTGSKEIINYLHRGNHSISYKNIRTQNLAWERMATSGTASASVIKPGLPLHSGIDNNDGRQETLTGYGTTHHTNTLFFQPQKVETETANTNDTIHIEATHPGTKEIPPYHIGVKVDPPCYPHHVDIDDDSLLQRRFDEDIIWSIAGGLPGDVIDDFDTQNLGSWTAFHRKISNITLNKAVLEYLPVIPQPPDYDTLKAYLDFLVDTTEDLGIHHIYSHGDEAVYSKLLQIMWKHGEDYKRIVTLMGGFHQLLALLKVVYKRHACVEYKKWFEDSGIIASGSVDKAVEGRHYYRSMRVHKEAFDAIVQGRVEKLTNNYLSIDYTLLSAFLEMRCNPTREQINAISNMSAFHSLRDKIIATTGTKSQMTLMYLKDISLVLSLVFAARESDLELHLQAEREMLKLFFAFDHVNYARYNSYQHVFLSEERRQNTGIYQELNTHGFTVSVTGDTFSAVHGDLITEWYNKETKGSGGPFRSGYSTDISAVNTYVRTTHIHAKLHREMKSRMRIKTSSTHKELCPTSIMRHTKHVSSLKETLVTYAVDLFADGPAVSISTGEEIDHTIINGLLNSKYTGNRSYLKFIDERLLKGTVSFFHRISTNKIKTGIAKPKKKPKQLVFLEEDRQAFGVLAAKAVSLNEAFQHPITTIPLSIAKAQTKLYSSDKAGFRNTVIKAAGATGKTPPLNARWIIDGMAVIRTLKREITYKDFFKKAINNMMPEGEYDPISLEIVMDTYIAYSTKDGTRESRGEKGTRIHVTGLGQKMPHNDDRWNCFLTNNDNKTDLIKLFVQYLISEEVREKFFIPVIITEEEKTWKIENGGYCEIFVCNHEEADSRVVLHASLTDEPCVIRSKDTDVLVLLTYGYHKAMPVSKWFMQYESEKYADISKVVTYLGADIVSSLPQFFSLTGCDTTSYFYNRGKTSVLNKVKKNPSCIKLIQGLGREVVLSDRYTKDIMTFIQTIVYSGRANESYVDTRVRLYEQQVKKSSISLPPDPSSCVQAIKRAHYQAFIWNRCLQKNIENIDLKDNGWKINCDEQVIPIWYTCSQLPESLKRKSKKKVYDADNETDTEISEPPVKRNKRRSTKPDFKERNPSEYRDADSEATETEYDNTATEAIISELSEWECASDFSSATENSDSSDSSDSDWAP